MLSVLTPEQKAQLEQMKAQSKTNRGGRRGQGGPRGDELTLPQPKWRIVPSDPSTTIEECFCRTFTNKPLNSNWRARRAQNMKLRLQRLFADSAPGFSCGARFFRESQLKKPRRRLS